MACVLGIIWLQIGFYSLVLGRKKYYITKRHCITSVLLYCFTQKKKKSEQFCDDGYNFIVKIV